MTVRWTEQAANDLELLHATIAEDSSRAADEMVDSILAGLESVKRFPESGRAGTRVEGTRELIVSPFLVVYRLKTTAIEVLAVIHGSRKWPAR